MKVLKFVSSCPRRSPAAAGFFIFFPTVLVGVRGSKTGLSGGKAGPPRGHAEFALQCRAEVQDRPLFK